MKKIITFLIILFVSLHGAYAFPWPFAKKDSKPKTTVVVEKKVEQKPTLSSGRDILKQLKSELVSAKDENLKLKATIKRLNDEAIKAKNEAIKVQLEVIELEKWAAVKQAVAEKYKNQYEQTLKRYHRLKMLVTFLIGGVGVFVGLQLMSLVPPPYNLGVPVVGGLLFAILSWLIF